MIDSNADVPKNARLPIVVIVFGNVTVCTVLKDSKNEKDNSNTFVVLNVTVLSAKGRVPPAVAEVPPNKYLKSRLATGSESKESTNVSSFVVPVKIPVPRLVTTAVETTDDGIVSDVSSGAFWNTLFPINVM